MLIQKSVKIEFVNELLIQATEDDFYVSEDIFKSYYYGDDGQSIRQVLTEVYGIDVQRVLIIDNNGSLEDSITQVYKFVDMMCGF